MKTLLNEKQWRQYLALEAKKQGNITQVAKDAGVSRNTVNRGLREIETEGLYQPGDRIRKKGADGKAVPYGIYDIVHNQGIVNVGIYHDTAEFSVESIRRWWRE